MLRREWFRKRCGDAILQVRWDRTGRAEQGTHRIRGRRHDDGEVAAATKLLQHHVSQVLLKLIEVADILRREVISVAVRANRGLFGRWAKCHATMMETRRTMTAISPIISYLWDSSIESSAKPNLTRAEHSLIISEKAI